MGIAQKEVKVFETLCYSNLANSMKSEGSLTGIEVQKCEILHSSASF